MAQGSNVASVSTVFYPGSHRIKADLVFSSSDSVLFFLHSHVVVPATKNAFGHLLSKPRSAQSFSVKTINIPETSDVLNVIVHALYGMSCVPQSPTFETLFTAVNQLPFYGIDPKVHITPTKPIFSHLLSFAPIHPLEVYIIAGHFDLYDLAVPTSSHLLSVNPSSINDDLAERIGPVYLKHLFCLHMNRTSTLKKILLSPPYPHPATPECPFAQQRKLAKAWVLAAGYLVWKARVGWCWTS